MDNYNNESAAFRSYIRGPKRIPPFVRIASATHHESHIEHDSPCKIYCNHARRYESVYRPGTQENPNYANSFY